MGKPVKKPKLEDVVAALEAVYVRLAALEARPTDPEITARVAALEARP
jgi:hypothetical protein